jgi:hypothetical protein
VSGSTGQESSLADQQWCGGIGWRGSAVAWIERYLSVVGVKVEVLRDYGDTSLVEKLLDDQMA